MLDREKFKNEIEPVMESNIKSFLQEAIKMYGQIEIMSIRAVTEENRRVFIHGRAHSVDEAMRIIKNANLIWKNTQYPVDVYYRPLSTEYKYLFFDFDTEPAKSTLENAYLYMETSPGRYHTYYKLEKSLNEAEYKKVAKALLAEATEVQGADPACVNANHWRRLGGFLSKKYGKPFEIQFYKGKNRVIPAGVIEKALKRAESIEKAARQMKVYYTTEDADTDTEALLWLQQMKDQRLINVRLPYLSYTEYRKRSRENDISRIDASWAIYALSKGATISEVYTGIMNGRGEELLKKHRRPWDYIARTINFALRSIETAENIILQNQHQEVRKI